VEATTERLAKALEAAGADETFVRSAREGHYDDFKSKSATPIVDLVRELQACGFKDLARRAIDGDFDSTPEEALAWSCSPEGTATFLRLIRR
jgi:hypothetical protein